jgi:hypothetical protein
MEERSGSRHILFAPDDDDLRKQAVAGYRVRTMGTACSDLDDCQPFLAWLKP